ncbi:hypothetical protein SAMN04515617_105151 [Collimonas sp. OK242]|uniref:hypothetical protein n=1 Tax=Collimonas sp. OK242 TaxID=1798195 RepID=UPI0008980113|nr:hypothetical protein [Collimonas sp. OK242]SDX63080.1 hypothetical protein SAMN04515617_105151 [Collimonas sp. OK242]
MVKRTQTTSASSADEAKSGPLYRAGTLKRDRRTNEQLEQLDQQIIDVLKDDHPQSVRHVFYRMTDPRLPEPVEKSDRGYRHVQDRCVKLRRSGRVRYDWIADMSRRGYFVTTFSGKGDFLSRMAGLYRSDLWALSDYRCEVWCESRSIASVIQKDCTELAVDLYPCGGFSSLSFVHEAAEAHNYSDDGRPLIIFYIGDYDPAGVIIDVALERELRLHLKPSIKLHFQRIGINEDQIALYDLPTKPRKESDTRSLQVASTVEAEAMPARILRALLRQQIEELLPEGALASAKVAEESERAGLRMLAGTFGE